MGLRRLSLLFLCAMLLSACEKPQATLLGQSLAAFQQSIINGDQCYSSESESAIALYVDAEVDFGVFGTFTVSSFMCGGTLIAPDVVLTAAHCLNPEGLTQGVGVIKRLDYYVTWDRDLSYLSAKDGPAVPRNAMLATKTMIHESYEPTEEDEDGLGDNHDVGLVFLKEPLKITPAIVITKEESEQILNGKTVQIAGWGQRTAAEINLNDPADAELVGKKFCARSTINEAGPYEMQIGSDVNSARKCFGDSGGPTYMQVMTKDGPQMRVIGITSHSYDDFACAKGGVDTRVDAWLLWIDAKMREGCASGQRSWCEVEGIILPQFSKDPESVMQIATGYIEQILAYIRAWLK